MKKKRLAALLIVAPLALFASCSSTPSLVLGANWFSDTSTKNIPDDFEETLEYAVSFEKSASAENGRFSLNYPNGGTYTVKFEDGEVNGKKTYVYTTELRIRAEYTLDGVSTKFEEDDVLKTRVEFLDAQNELRPLSSSREAHVTAPLSNASSAPSSLDAAYAKYDYKMETVYDHENETATFTLTNLASEETANHKKVTEIDIDKSGHYFDNEQLFPLLRAAELSSSMSLYTIDPTTGTVDNVTVKDGPNAATLKQSVRLNGGEAVEREFNVTEISIAYAKQNSGATQKFTIAQRTHRDSNTYRNVVLKCEYPVIYSLGVLTYRLTSANFYTPA